jgi:uncharacterized protein (TIGR02466 family)
MSASAYQIAARFVFPTQIIQSDNAGYPGVKPEFLAMCHREKARDPAGVQKANVHGWQSRDDALFHPDNRKQLEFLRGQIDACLASEFGDPAGVAFVIGNAWINITGKHGYAACHVHPQSLLSGVFYVSIPENSGALTFYDTKEFQSYRELQLKSAALRDRLGMNPNLEYSPVEGRMLLFPSWLPHDVGMNCSAEDRISISFNIIDFPKALNNRRRGNRPGASARLAPAGREEEDLGGVILTSDPFRPYSIPVAFIIFKRDLCFATLSLIEVGKTLLRRRRLREGRLGIEGLWC